MTFFNEPGGGLCLAQEEKDTYSVMPDPIFWNQSLQLLET
jgi:hypothetical protein